MLNSLKKYCLKFGFFKFRFKIEKKRNKLLTVIQWCESVPILRNFT